MCGICGMVDIAVPQEGFRAAYIQNANDNMHHRGPDEAGVYADDWGSIAMRRLSIIDLSSGCLLYTSPSPRDLSTSRMPSSA